MTLFNVVPAHAAPHTAMCSGSCYNNTDPQNTGCNVSSAYTVTSATVYVNGTNGGRSGAGGESDLRFSGNCGANWTKTVNYYYGQSCFNSCFRSVDGRIYWKDSWGNCQYWDVSSTQSYSSYWTNQEWLPNSPAETWTYFSQQDVFGNYTGSGTGAWAQSGFGTYC